MNTIPATPTTTDCQHDWEYNEMLDASICNHCEAIWVDQPNNSLPVIFTYTMAQAEEDGILIPTSTLFPDAQDHLVSHITTNLLITNEYLVARPDTYEYDRGVIATILNNASIAIAEALAAQARWHRGASVWALEALPPSY